MRFVSNPSVAAGLIFIVPVIAFGLLLLTVLPNPMLTLVALLVLTLIWWGALQNPLRTVAACVLSVQWLQASGLVWVANLNGVSLATPNTARIAGALTLEIAPHTADAILLALAGVAAVSAGIRLTLPTFQVAAADFANFAPERLALLYLPALLISRVAGPVFGGAAAQLIYQIGSLRFVPVVLLIGVWFFGRRGGRVLLAIILAEIGLGFTRYFSDWKDVLILTGITLLALVGRAWKRWIPFFGAGLTALVLLGVVWTVIKPSYREALNGGAKQQVIVLSYSERVDALSQQISGIGPDDLVRGLNGLMLRISYTSFLSDVLTTVPSRVDFQNGGLWGEALQQFLAPRFLFPNKPALPSDSERTMRYTGRVLASGVSGTSFSIGYVGDSYIDFGIAGALVLPLLIGAIYGWAVRAITLLSNPRNGALALALVIPFLMPAQQFEMSNVKLVGEFTWLWIACVLFIVVIWPRISPFLRTRRNTPMAAAAP